MEKRLAVPLVLPRVEAAQERGIGVYNWVCDEAI